MNFTFIGEKDDLTRVVRVLNESHGTVAEEYGFTKETNPTNSAFIDGDALRKLLQKGIELYSLGEDENLIGCIAIEKSMKEPDTYYIEKVSVLPKYRRCGYGLRLMEFATEKIRKKGGKWISIALIDANKNLKNWYLKQGFMETGTKIFPNLPFTICFMNMNII
jgi:ribosomal protein S18 acetylase RimI-like enzyme